MLCSLYSFEYPWTEQSVPVPDRLFRIESNWAYFAGFGTPTAVLTFFLPIYVSLGVYAMLFPFCIILATRSTASAALCVIPTK